MKKPTNRQKPVELDGEAVLNTIRMLEKAGKLQTFIEDCRKQNFVLTASAELVAFGKEALNSIAGVKSTGPECPACPFPRR